MSYTQRLDLTIEEVHAISPCAIQSNSLCLVKGQSQSLPSNVFIIQYEYINALTLN